MKKRSFKRGLMATSTICGAALLTMAGGALVATVATMVPVVAQAQDYTSGALVGTVTDAAGAPVSNATVTLTSVAQGQARTATTNGNGQFTATGLQPGEYSVAVVAPGYTDYSGTATIVISQEVRYNYAMTAVGAEATTVVVKGKRVRQDFTKTTTGLTVDLDTLVERQPIARNLTAVTMLAPTVTMGNPDFGTGDRAVASFGGSSVAENAYYIDGLNITNPDTYVGSARVPFDFYKTIEVKTGGYAAEFGRATGGVVNATTKSGTNEFMFAIHGDYAPMDMRSSQLDTYDYRGSFSSIQSNSLTVEMGGPLIKDHLFAYGLYQINDYEKTKAGINTGTYTDIKNTDPFLGFKVDGYITPTQHLSLTYFDTSNTEKSKLYSYDDETLTVGDAQAPSNEEFGGQNWVLNYNGKVTDWFTVSAAIGDSKDRDNVLPSDTTSYFVRDYDTIGQTSDASSNTPTVISAGQPSSVSNIQESERKFWRADADFRFEAFGRHHVRMG
ncbi:MAG: carboxypeptidase regulatory-like domain-containing protein, partial [Asticcacaulis sp.]